MNVSKIKAETSMLMNEEEVGPMTAEKLRKIAEWMDLVDVLLESWIKLVPDKAVELKVELGDGPYDTIQRDLRIWADSLESRDIEQEDASEGFGGLKAEFASLESRLEALREVAMNVVWEWEDDGSPNEWTGWERHGTFKALAKELGVWNKRERAVFRLTHRGQSRD